MAALDRPSRGMDAKREVPMDPAPTTLAPPTAGRRALPATRAVLATFAVLSTLALISLFFFSDRTNEWFAWTIAPPLSAAFFGACFGSTLVVEILSLRQAAWAPIRLNALAIFVFASLTLAATLIHLDKFHLQGDNAATFQAQAAAWFWLVVYIVVPLALPVLMVLQERAPGADRPDRWPVPPTLRGALGLESAVLLVVGIALFAVPTTAATLWPWPLTPLVAQVTGAWLVAFGLVSGVTAVAGDLGRQRSATIAYTVLGALVLIATVRFRDTVAWDRPAGWIYLAMAVAITLTGAAGWRLAPSPEEFRSG
jgi:MFS family permease